MSIDKIAIIVVTYNPDLNDLKCNIESYVNQVSLVVIVDNSTNKDIQKQIRDISSEYKNTFLNTLGDNFGIAKAQNIGYDHAINQGFEYFIEMDQDSYLEKSYVKDIYDSYVALQAHEHNIAGIGPLAVNKDNDEIYHDVNNDLGEVPQTLSSGFFIPKKSFEIVGYKNEEYFIDYVDWEWNWRAKKFGLTTFINKKLIIRHMLGDGHKKILAWKIGIPSPIRHYYQYRNSLYLMKVDHIQFSWKIKRIAINFIKLFLIIIFLDNKRLRIKYIFSGIKDFILNKKGKISCAD